jgi:O-antigen/teichoic acid export membrane protein
MLRNTLIALQGTVIAQGIGFLFLPLLTRLYSPEAFAGYQLYMSILMLLLVAASMRYEVALLGAKKDGEERAVLRLCMGLNVVAALLVFAVCAGLIWRRPAWLTVSDTVLWLLSLGVVGGGFLQTFGYVLLREQAININANSKIAQVVIFCVAGIVAYATGFTQTGLVGADAFSRLAAAGLILFWIVRNRAWIFASAAPGKLAEVSRRFCHFPMLTVPGALLSAMIGVAVPILMLAAFGSSVMGQYALVERTILMPAALIGSSVAQAFTAQLSTALQDGKPSHAAFRKVVMTMLGLGLAPALALLIFAPDLFKLVFGAQWVVAGSFAQVLSIVSLSSMAMAPVNMTLLVTGRQQQQFAWEIARLLLVLVGWTAVIKGDLLPIQAIMIHAAILVVMNGVFLWLADRALRTVPSQSLDDKGTSDQSAAIGDCKS